MRRRAALRASACSMARQGTILGEGWRRDQLTDKHDHQAKTLGDKTQKLALESSSMAPLLPHTSFAKAGLEQFAKAGLEQQPECLFQAVSSSAWHLQPDAGGGAAQLMGE